MQIESKYGCVDKDENSRTDKSFDISLQKKKLQMPSRESELHIEGYETFQKRNSTGRKIWAKIQLNGRDRMLIGWCKSPRCNGENIEEPNKLLAGIPDRKEFSHILIMRYFYFRGGSRLLEEGATFLWTS